MKTLLVLSLLLLPITGFAQMHTYSNAWSYVTSTVTSSFEFSATTIAGTGGTATHTMSAVMVYIQSPAGRTAGASDYSGGTTGQATAYLSLCGGGICEDGMFLASTVGTTEYCGQTGTAEALPVQEGPKAVDPWVYWTHSTLVPSTIARQSGEADFEGLLQKSANCGGVPSISIGLGRSPSEIMISPDPNSNLAAEFQQNTGVGTVKWKVKTDAANQHGGTVVVGAGFEVLAAGCKYTGPPVTSKILTVSP